VAFGTQQFALQLEIAAEAAEGPARADDAMARRAWVAAFTEDAADGPMGARRSGQRRDVAIGGDPARRNAPDRGQHAAAECRPRWPRRRSRAARHRQRPTTAFTRNVSPPRSFSPNAVMALFGIWSTEVRTDDHSASPAMASHFTIGISAPPVAWYPMNR
jgi:hypothetical protein